MFSQEVLIRRYTPPTCTLELSGNRSPLYLWTGQKRVKDLRFELRFDDPRNPTEDQIMVKGDRTQLLLLSDVVNHYIQNFLKSTSSDFPLTASSTATLAKQTITLPSVPSLHALGLLTHELSFGSLIVTPPQSSVSLSVSQLYDLANALEEYNTDVSIADAIAKPQWQQVATTWLGTAAAAFLLALGVGTASIRIREMQQTANRPNSEPPPQSIVQDVLPPVPPPPTGTPVPSPSVPPSLAQRQPLPTPSNVTALPPPPRNPSIPIVIPPRTVLPPPPVVPQPNTAIIITPQTGNPSSIPPSRTVPTLPPPVAPKATQTLPADVFNPNPPAPNLPELPPLASSSATSQTTINNAQSDKTQTSLLDTIPQVGEARQYFQARWKPPESLKQTLEYRLVLSQDGSISRIIPLGQASKIYLDRTSIPLIGESFVSPLEIAGNPQIRLVLSPDGTVRTFMEE